MDLTSSDYSSNLITIGILNLIALVSPGPAFAIVVRNSLRHSRKKAILTALGISLADTVHVTYNILASTLLFTKTPLALLQLIKFLGSMYLGHLGIKTFYTGYRILRTNHTSAAKKTTEPTLTQPSLSSAAAFFTGFTTNLLNPKAVLFFFTIFTTVINKNTPLIVLVLYGLMITMSVMLWFTFLALFFSKKNVQTFFHKITHWVEIIIGLFLMILSVKLMFSYLG